MDTLLENIAPPLKRPSFEEAEDAVRTLILWAGDNPERSGLRDTPARVVRAYRELFSGYDRQPAPILQRVFEETGGYDDIVLVRDIAFSSHCEHHMLPFKGRCHVGYLPDGPVVGLSKIARVVDIFARRLQTQEHLTSQIALALHDHLKVPGVAVMCEAEHMCMSMRGVALEGSATTTLRFIGAFDGAAEMQARFLQLIRR